MSDDLPNEPRFLYGKLSAPLIEEYKRTPMSSIDSILIVGAGWTGRQIAAQCASHGIAVFVFDSRPTVVHESIEWALKHAASLAEQQIWPSEAAERCKQNLHAIEELAVLPLEIDLALECVTEQPSVKRRVLKEVSSRFGKSTIVASNSSYFTPSMLNNYVLIPERFAHLHFHAPIWMSTVVDIVPGPNAEPGIVERLKEFACRIGQTPLVQTVENSGYVFNDILRSMLTKALELAHRGVATPNDIESTWKKITGCALVPLA